MGHKGSKPNAPTKPEYNFKQYGLTAEEGDALEKYYNDASGKDHTMDHAEFQRVYLMLNPEMNHGDVKAVADKAFATADKSHDGHITFEEFLAFYILHKSPPQKVSENLKPFIADTNGKSQHITPSQAEHYANFANNYYDKPEGGPHGAQIRQDLHGNHGEHIPIDNFAEHLEPHIQEHHHKHAHHHHHHNY